jgi:hypothetical protein
MTTMLKDYAIMILLAAACFSVGCTVYVLLRWTWRALCWGVCAAIGWFADPEDVDG